MKKDGQPIWLFHRLKSSLRSRQLAFALSTRKTFFPLRQRFNCFSRAMALRTSPKARSKRDCTSCISGKTLSWTQLMLSDSALEKVCDSAVACAGIAGPDVYVINHACGPCVISPKNIPASPITVIPSGGPTVFVGRESRHLSSFARMMRI